MAKVTEDYTATGRKIYNLRARARNKEFVYIYTSPGGVELTEYDIINNAVVFKDAPTADFSVDITDAVGFIPSVTYDIVDKANVDLGNVTGIPEWIKTAFLEDSLESEARAKIHAQAANVSSENAEVSMEIVRDREDLMSPHYPAIDELGDETTAAALDRLNAGDTAENIDRLNTGATASNIDRLNTGATASNIDRLNTGATAENIDRVKTSADNLDRVHTSISKLDRVHTSISKLDRVHTSISKLDRVHTSIAQVDAVYDKRLNIDTVADDIGKVVKVSDDIYAVVKVSDDIGKVSTVAASIPSVNTVANSIDNEHLDLIGQDLAKAFDGDPDTHSSVINSHSWSLAAHVSAIGTEVLNQAIGVNHVDITAKHLEVTANLADVVDRQEDITTKQTDITAKHGEVEGWRDETEAFRNETQALANLDMQTVPTGNPSVVPITGPDGKLDVEWMNLDGEITQLATGIIGNANLAIQNLLDIDAETEARIASDDVETEARIAGDEAEAEARIAWQDLLEGDLDGKHNAGEAFNYAIFNQAEQAQLVDASQFEYQAEIMRNLGGSGVTNSRQYEHGGDETYHQPHDIGYSAINQHNHNNYKRMVGQAETSTILNGFYLRTRHNDYNLIETVDGGFLDTEFGDVPTVPASVTNAGSVAAQTEEMREYFKAYAAGDTSIRDYTSHFFWSLSYIEMWFEQLSDELVDPFDSFRHTIDAATMRELLAKNVYLSQGGHKNRFENVPFFGQVIRFVDDEGKAQIGTLKYRMVTKNVGNVGEFDPQACLDQRHDYATRARFDYSDWESMRKDRRARFRLKHHRDRDERVSMRTYTPGILDEMMQKVPGLDGPSNMLLEAYDQYDHEDTLTEHDSTVPLNAGYYNRYYSFEEHDASNRHDAKRGFNDPMMFTAMTTRPEVVDLTVGDETKRFSYSMPFELILRTPLEAWNPHNLMEHNEKHDAFVANQAADGRFGTQAAPYHGYNTEHYYAFTPDDFFDGATLDKDPADTDGDAQWVLSNMGNGAGVPVRNSGIHIHLPPIAGVSFNDDAVHGFNQGTSGVLRTRFPVYSTFWEGNASHAEMDGRSKIQADESAESAVASATAFFDNVLTPKLQAIVSGNITTVDDDGEVTSTLFVGDGSGLTNVDADKLDGKDSSEFALITADGTINAESLVLNGTINAESLVLNGKNVSPINSTNMQIMPSERQFNATYDFMSSRNDSNTQDTYPYNMNKALSSGVISSRNSGIDNLTTYNTTPWNYHFMYELKWTRYSTDSGMQIVCPPNTDIITVRVHQNGWQIMSLANADGTFPCREGTSYDSRIYKTSGYGHSQSVGAWGEYNKEHHHTFAYFNVPRSSSAQTFTLIRGHHTHNRAEVGWISGLAFNTNPNLFATANAIDYHWYSNGGNATGWHKGDWNESNLGYIAPQTAKILKVPVAPDTDEASGKRKLYVIGHGNIHNQHLQYVEINNKKYQLKPDGFPIAQALRDSAGSAHNFYVATFEIDEGDIPAAVLEKGGVIDVSFNNQEYNQDFYFTEVGTYKSEVV